MVFPYLPSTSTSAQSRSTSRLIIIPQMLRLLNIQVFLP
jgi:hypothetical protein